MANNKKSSHRNGLVRYFTSEDSKVFAKILVVLYLTKHLKGRYYRFKLSLLVFLVVNLVTSAKMSLLSLFKFSARSFVHTISSEKTVELPAKDGKYISLSDLVHKDIPEARDNAWYWNSWMLGNGNLQTFYTQLEVDKENQIYYGRRIIVWQDDGSSVSVDYVLPLPKSKVEWAQALKYCPIENPPPSPPRTRYLTEDEIEKLYGPSDTEQKPLVIALHGLTGGSYESYVRHSIGELISKDYDFDCLVLNSRGCARTKITTPELFCALMTEDIRRLVKLIKKTQPNRRLYLMGFSLGASVLANYLGQERENVQVDAAVCLANPWDLNDGSIALHETFLGAQLYSPKMAQNLLRLIKNHRHMLTGHPVFDEGQKETILAIKDFDNAYTAPFFGFDTADDYYRHASSVNRLTKVRTPLLILML